MSDDERFEQVFRSTYADLSRFAVRRVGTDRAEDVVAQTYEVAWRRRDVLPAEPARARAWLFTTCRHLVLADGRARGRERALAVRLDAQPGGQVGGAEEEAVAAADVAAAWDALTAAEQEVLSLALLEDLTAQDAGQVLGISPVAYRLRLMRARRSLAARMQVVEVTPTGRSVRYSYDGKVLG